jgi:predicted acylesterase/phospholipase RssA
MPREHSAQENVDVDGSPELLDHRHPLAVVLGGGGVWGIAFNMGVAEGLIAAGVPVDRAPSLGTSAGSWAASALAFGLRYSDLADLDVPSVPARRRGILADIAREVFDDRSHHQVSVSAVCLRSRRRHILDGGRYPLADLVAASSAVPGLLPPHRIDGRLYIDGGMWSATSVDAAAEADQVIVVAPLAGDVLGPMGRTAGLLLERELRRWRRRHPESTITMIRPDRAMARTVGVSPLNLFDGGRARAVYPLAFAQGLAIGRELSAPGAATSAGRIEKSSSVA